MTAKVLTPTEIENLIKENDSLRREVKYLKRLTSSKRFAFAVKVADTYNQFFPLDTKRRAFVSSLGRSYAKHRAKRAEKKTIKYTARLAKLANNYDRVFVLNTIPYDTPLKQRPHHLAHEFAKLGYFVIYLEEDNPVHPLRKITKNFVTINSHKFLSQISAKQKFFFTANNLTTPLDVLKEVHTWGFQIIYDYLDEFHEDIAGDLVNQLAVWDHLKELGPTLGVATASKLQKDLSAHLDKTCPVIVASNAVNVEHFDYTAAHHDTPEDLEKILRLGKPIIGFYGALAPWIDFRLINTIAEHHPEWSIVLIGMNYEGAMKALRPAENIHYLGTKDYNQLPAYATHFNCAIIPFCTGEIAKATSPVKLFEYMAAGLPTVCTKDLEECKGYDYVYMADGAKDFERKIAKALKDYDTPAARTKLLATAKENTWSKRAATIDENLRKATNG